MEVIGAVSGVVALVESTSKMAKSLTNLARRWNDAPGEIHALASTTRKLSTEFLFVQDTVANSHALLLDDVVRCGLLQLTSEAATLMAEIEALQSNLESCGYITKRTRWALKDARNAARILDKMLDVEDGLAKWTSFLSLKGQSLTMQQFESTQRILTVGFAEMKQMFSAVAMSESTSSRLPVPPLYQHPSTHQAADLSMNSLARRTYEDNGWEKHDSLESVGLHSHIIKRTQGRSTEYDLGFRFNLPLAWLFGSYALIGQLGIRTSPRQNTLTLRHPSYLSVARVLEDSHPFLQAFRKNDLAAIRSMLLSGEGRPTDIDRQGRGCIYYNVIYCSPELLIELLDNGIDIDGPVVPELMTALEFAAFHQRIDLLRVLLQRGASADHVGARGLNAFFYCFYPDKRNWQQKPTMDTVRVLNEYVWMDPGATFDYGGTALHAAAMFSLDVDIDSLVRLGCDLEQGDNQGSTALRYAAEYGNPSAYFALLRNGAKIAGDSTNSAADLLMNTIVCKATVRVPSEGFVEFDHDTIVRHLLRHHISARSFLYIHGNCSWPASIKDRDITWPEFAATYGPETQTWLEGLLQECWSPNSAERHSARVSDDMTSNEEARKEYVIGEKAIEAQHSDTHAAAAYHCEDDSPELRGDDGIDNEDEESFWDAAEVLL